MKKKEIVIMGVLLVIVIGILVIFKVSRPSQVESNNKTPNKPETTLPNSDSENTTTGQTKLKGLVVSGLKFYRKEKVNYILFKLTNNTEKDITVGKFMVVGKDKEDHVIYEFEASLPDPILAGTYKDVEIKTDVLVDRFDHIVLKEK